MVSNLGIWGFGDLGIWEWLYFGKVSNTLDNSAKNTRHELGDTTPNNLCKTSSKLY
jgi:hypothetical protein